VGTLYDLLIYHDFTDTFEQPVRVGDSAAIFGQKFADLHVVALGPGIHEGRRTVVLAHGDRPMTEVQALIERRART
jgi:hypothetical protein